MGTFVSARESAENWAATQACSNQPDTTSSLWANTTVQIEEYTSCNNNQRVVSAVAEDTGHGFDRGTNARLMEEVLEFFGL